MAVEVRQFKCRLIVTDSQQIFGIYHRIFRSKRSRSRKESERAEIGRNLLADMMSSSCITKVQCFLRKIYK